MSEPTQRMDRIYRHQRHIYDMTRKYYLLGRDALIAELDVPFRGTVLEIGCGTGRNLVKIARAYPTARCYGLDISREMLATAETALLRAGLERRIALAQADAAAFDPAAIFAEASFDRVVTSYALSMMPPWREVLRRAASVVAPGGSLHVVDFGDQAGLPSAFKALLIRWLAAFHVTPRSALPGAVTALAEDMHMQARVWSRYRGYAVAARLDRAA